MISVVTCTHRGAFIPQIIANMKKQTLMEKELILIINASDIDLDQTKRMLDQSGLSHQLLYYPNPMSLGKCLNQGSELAKYKIIAKCDDDDFYGKDYLKEAYETLNHVDVDVIGKSSFYIYFEEEEALYLYNSNHEHHRILNRGRRFQSTDFLSGATLVFNKKILDQVNFPHLNVGEDSGFQRQCYEKGIPMYSTSKENYAYIRYNQPTHHTSDTPPHLLKRKSHIVSKGKEIKEFFGE